MASVVSLASSVLVITTAQNSTVPFKRIWQSVDDCATWSEVAAALPWADSVHTTVTRFGSQLIAVGNTAGVWRIALPGMAAADAACNMAVAPLSVVNGDAGTCVKVVPDGGRCSIRCAAGFLLVGAPLLCAAGTLSGAQYCAASNPALVGSGSEAQLLLQSAQHVSAGNRVEVGMAVVRGTLYVYGGADADGNHFNDVWVSTDR